MALESRCCLFFKRSRLVSKKFDHWSVKRTRRNSWKWRAIHLEQQTIHCIPKLLLFSLKFSLKQVFLKGRQIIEKYLKWSLFFDNGTDWEPAALPKMYFKHFQGIMLRFAIFQYFSTFLEPLFPTILFHSPF